MTPPRLIVLCTVLAACSTSSTEELELLELDTDSPDAEEFPGGPDGFGQDFDPQRGVFENGTLWDTDDLVVCWTNPDSDNSQGRGWVEDAVRGGWGAVSRIRFLGWGDCDDTPNPDITIAVGDFTPRSEFGIESRDAQPSMRLNFEYDNYQESRCDDDGTLDNGKSARRNCIENNALHEFGHALGLRHEHSHPDKTSDCDRNEDLDASGRNGIALWSYDANSVMNYCNVDRWSDPQLSMGDIQAINTLYPSQVIVFDGADTSGARQVFGPGKYRANAGQLGVIGNDRISAMAISPGLSVRTCQSEGSSGEGGGQCATYAGPVSLAGTSLNNSISYLEVIPKAWVFSDPGYDGDTQQLEIGKHLANAGDLDQVGNDTISSVLLPHGLSARVCLHEGSGSGSGTCTTTFGGKPFDQALTPQVAASLDNGISYVDVGVLVIAYADQDFRGEGLPHALGTHSTEQGSWLLDDEISSLVIPPGLQVSACTGGDGSGQCQTFNTSVASIGASLDDAISYLHVRRVFNVLAPLPAYPVDPVNKPEPTVPNPVPVFPKPLPAFPKPVPAFPTLPAFPTFP